MSDAPFICCTVVVIVHVVFKLLRDEKCYSTLCSNDDSSGAINPKIAEPASDIKAQNKIAVIGCGVSGCLMALLLGKRGFDVTVFEKRTMDDVIESNYTSEGTKGRHIGVLMSERGVAPLRKAGLSESDFEFCSKELKGRCVHCGGSDWHYYYWNSKMYSFDRDRLVKCLYDRASTYDNVSFKFGSEMTQIEEGVNNEVLIYISEDADPYQFHAVIGADGVNSVVRRLLMKREMNLAIETSCDSHSYKSLRLYPRSTSSSSIQEWDADFIHTWPRKDILLHAMPSVRSESGNRYYNCTLCIPTSDSYYSADSPLVFSLEGIRIEQTAKSLLQTLVPDFFDHAASKESMVEQMTNNPSGPLRVCKVSRFHSETLPIVMVGDAIHPVVPYSGQGMVSALEDCHVLHTVMLQNGHLPFMHQFSSFNKCRKKDIDAMQDIAIDQYNFLYHTSASKLEQFRRAYQAFMHQLFPRFYAHSLYDLLANPDLSYSKVAEIQKNQNKWYYFGRI